LAVSWIERGDPAGAPVVHFHGWPSSRLEQFAGEALLRQFGIRWLSLDRPGYGETPFVAPHTFANWARTVEAWADTQGLGRFHLSGFSGGGPFAQAVAAHLGERILSLNLIASLAPFGHHGVQCDPPWSGVKGLVLDHVPFLASGGLQLMNRWRRFGPRSLGRFQLSLLHPLDREILTQPNHRERMEKSLAVAMHQGVGHILADLYLYRAAWDFDYDAIRCPTHIWAGSSDIQVPPECSRWLARRIAGARLKEYEGEAHYLALNHACEIIETIAAVRT
jgi:pimeloyl-ACP methyl ester carboxylesterase